MRGPKDKTRLSWWFPRLPPDIPTPETAIIPYAGDSLFRLLDGETPTGFAALCDGIAGAGDGLGWPLFLRTDYLSAKHGWKDTCHVPGPGDVRSRVAQLVEFSAVADFMGFPVDCWIARKFIPTRPAFSAFHGDMPIVKERRYFVQDAKVVCHHPYWPAEAFDDTRVSVESWRELLDAMNAEGDGETRLLSELSGRVGAALGGAWSIDWLWSEDERRWYLTDMAEAATSYHWPGCPLESG